jgi:hypothetical protein
MSVVEEKTNEMHEQETIAKQEVPLIIYEFLDTLLKIRKIETVLGVHFAQKMSDIYVVTEKDDVDLSENIMEKFATWEASYKVFPELHIINKEETFYIPDGAMCI